MNLLSGIINKMTKKSELGKAGEDFACEYLIKNGYKIIDRNFREKWGELDIVAISKDKTLIFVEVKTMQESNLQGLWPEDQMTAAKIKKFKKVASLYAGHNQNLINDKKGWRLDLIALEVSSAELLTKDENNFRVKHYQNI